MQKVAVIGAGMAGLNLAYYLLEKRPHMHLDIYHDEALNQSASAIATGLLSPYSGQYLSVSAQAVEAYRQTEKLLKHLEEKSQQTLILYRQVPRIAKLPRQLKAFKRRAKSCGEFLDFQGLNRHFSFLKDSSYFGFLHPYSLCLHMPSYLGALKAQLSLYPHCYFKAQKWSEGFFLSSTQDYQAVFVAAGKGSLSLLPQPVIKTHGLNLIKGQVLSFDKQALEKPLVAKQYLIPLPLHKGGSLMLGATYEKQFSHLTPEKSPEVQRMLQEASELFPPLKERQAQQWQASARLCSASHSPLWGRLTDKLYLLTALGSKGLLTHSLLAKKLVEAYLKCSKPQEVLGATLLWE